MNKLINITTINKFLRTMTVLLMTFIIAIPLSAQTLFFNQSDVELGFQPFTSASDDINNDGNTDLITGLYEKVSIVLGNGDGTFGSSFDLPMTSNVRDVALGDFNSDGNLDLVAAHGIVTIHLGNGNGTFGSSTNLNTGIAPISLTKGDFNSDGNLDIAAANYWNDNISVILGNGDGTFETPINYTVGSEPHSIVVGDINNDFISDIATANWEDKSITILLGIGDGTFGSILNLTLTGNPHEIALEDFDNDGSLDIAVTDYYSDNISILLGNGNGTFNNATSYNVAADRPNSLKIGDFNLDGKSDLAVANNDGSFSILFGTGSGTFTNATNFCTGSQATSILIDDFNGDSKPDVVVTSRGERGIVVHLQLSANAHTITISTGQGGSIKPSCNNVSVENGDDKTLSIIPNNRYRIEDVLINGNSIGPVENFTFTNVIEDHTISAIFARISIHASAGPNGTISPSGEIIRWPRSRRGQPPITKGLFTITPDYRYQIRDVNVDGVSVGPVETYIFSDITFQQSHTISAFFRAISTEMINSAAESVLSYLTNPDKKISDAVEKAIKHIDKSLNPEIWVDENHLDPKHGKKVFDELKKAVKELTDKKFTSPFLDDALTAINYIQIATSNLAQVAIDEVNCNDDKCEKELDKANEEMVKAQEELVDDDYDKAIDHYKKAWEHALKAFNKMNGKMLDDDGDAEAALASDGIATEFTLKANYPNPFNPTTTIQYGLATNGLVNIQVYDILGQLVTTLVNSEQSQGIHSVIWNGTNQQGKLVPGGTYFTRITSGNEVRTSKMLFLK